MHIQLDENTRWTKQQIFDAFNGYFSKASIRKVDDEYRLIGKFCYIAPMEDGLWDVWITTPADLSQGLTEHKLTAILKKLPATWQARRLTGEAYTQVPLESLISQLAFLRRTLGVKKKSSNKGRFKKVVDKSVDN